MSSWEGAFPGEGVALIRAQEKESAVEETGCVVGEEATGCAQGPRGLVQHDKRRSLFSLEAMEMLWRV